MKNGNKLFIVVNVDWFFLSHRLPIALEAKKRGYQVSILAIEEEGRGEEIRSYGFRFIPLPSSRGGTNLIEDIKFMLALFQLYKREQPDIVHHVALKPVIYGSFAARLAGIKKVVNAISGLGSNFIATKKTPLTSSIIQVLYRASQAYENIRVIVQNSDDLRLIQNLCKLRNNQLFLIKGSGVELSKFKYVEEPENGPIVVVLISRMLWDKGIKEFEQASKKLKQKFGKDVRFVLAGKVDPQNKSSIKKEQLEKWNDEGNIEWIGFQKNVLQLNEKSHIAVLPSYREGLPKSLVEALAVGRPIITTDVPGCREMISKKSKNGILVPVKNEKELANAMEKLITDKALRIRMGRHGRLLVEKEMSLKMVLDKTFAIYERKN